MAKVIPSSPVDSISGKMHHNERIVWRTRNGRTHAYAILNPYKGPLAESRKAAINNFAQAVKQCKLEMNDPDRLAYWQQQFADYQKQLRHRSHAPYDKTYSTLRGFIIASLSRNP